MGANHLLKDFRLNRIRKVIIYTSFIILVISLLFPLVNIDNSFVQKISLIFLIYGFFLWGIEHLFSILSDFGGNYELFQIIVILLWISSTILGFLTAFEQSFEIDFIDLIQNKT